MDENILQKNEQTNIDNGVVNNSTDSQGSFGNASLNSDVNIESLLQEIIVLKQEILSEKESKLRALADLQNYMRLTQQRLSEAKSTVQSMLLGKMIDLSDDGKIAFEHIQDVSDPDQIKDAFQAILSKLSQVIESQGIIEVDCKVGDDFNPEYMEAIQAIPVGDGVEKNKVVIVLQKGFKYADTGKLIRAARVMVGS